MPTECSRYALFFSLVLFRQLVNCGFWQNIAWNNPSQDPNPVDSSQPMRLPSDSALLANQSVQPSPSYYPGCQASICTIQVSSVSLFYWPQESTNTACLATIPSLPAPTIPYGLIPTSPSAYAFFFSVTINDGCGSILTTYPTSTASIDPSQLSTLDIGGHTRSFNLADLPCPPPSVTLQPGQPYQPILAWKYELIFQNNDAPVCKAIAGIDGWIDPPRAFPTATGGLPLPQAGIHRPGRLRREPANAHVTSWIPARSTTAN